MNSSRKFAMSVPELSRSQTSFIPNRSSTSAAVRNPSNYYPAHDVSSRFGARLRQLRKIQKLTQLQMSVKFGIDRTFISDVERGRRSISLSTLEILALGLKMTLSDLLRDI